MNIKKLALAFSLTAAFCYMGCEDSATAPASGDDQQPISSESNGAGGEKVTSSESAGEEPGDKTGVSSDSNGGKAPESSGDAAPESSAGGFTFDSTGFTFDSTAYAERMKCDEEGAVQETFGIKMTCVGGQWEVDSASVASMMNCEAGETMEQMGMVLVCEDGQWAYDSTATAAANKCDEEGATKTETMSMMGMDIEMNYVCKDGQWSMDMGGFPGGGTGSWGDSSFTMPGGGSWGDSSFTGFPGGGQGGFPGGGQGGFPGGGDAEIPEIEPVQ